LAGDFFVFRWIVAEFRSLTLTTPFFAKVATNFFPLLADSDAALVPRACVSFWEKALASSPEIVIDPKKLLLIAMLHRNK
jgi:hypothetical protein